MHLHISANDGVPIYLQIVQQVKYLIAAGRLAAGEDLPPIRVLAEQLLINPNTVARAYRELEVAGIVIKRRTTGTYVADAPVFRLPRHERIRILVQRIDTLLAEARQMNIELDEIVAILRQRDSLMRAGSRTEG